MSHATATKSARELVKLAASMCRDGGVTPQMAASRVMASATPDTDSLLAMATYGLSCMVNDRLAVIRTSLFRRDLVARTSLASTNGHTNGSVKPVSQANVRRATLYHKVRSALDAVYAAADGTMKSLRRFTLADHESRLSDLKAEIGGLVTMRDFHTSCVRALRAGKVDCVGSLPVKQQAALAGMLS